MIGLDCVLSNDKKFNFLTNGLKLTREVPFEEVWREMNIAFARNEYATMKRML